MYQQISDSMYVGYGNWHFAKVVKPPEEVCQKFFQSEKAVHIILYVIHVWNLLSDYLIIINIKGS